MSGGRDLRRVGLATVAGACVAGAVLIPGLARGASNYDASLNGSFAMRGTITSARNIYGERRGQRVSRRWVFSSSCGTAVCPQVTLTRQRSERRITDVLTLKRVGKGTYSGTGQFWVTLRCGRQVISRGGRAKEKIVVRIRGIQTAGGAPYATALSATYQSLSRVNLTACPGGIGSDAAKYSGRLTSPPPGGPSSGGATPSSRQS